MKKVVKAVLIVCLSLVISVTCFAGTQTTRVTPQHQQNGG